MAAVSRLTAAFASARSTEAPVRPKSYSIQLRFAWANSFGVVTFWSVVALKDRRRV